MMQYFKSLAAQGLARRVVVLSLMAAIFVLSPMATASILPTGPCPNTPPAGSGPVCDATGQPTGTLLANLSVAFTGIDAMGNVKYGGTLISAVYRETGTLTLDFYYQVINSLTAGAVSGNGCGHGGGQAACNPVSRETDTNFTTWLTQLAFRTDGSGPFTAGDTPPQFADRNSGAGDVIGFEFNPLDSQKIFPGHISNVLIISTDAKNFALGSAQVLDGGIATVLSYEPTSATPEPASFALLGLGLVVLGGISRRLKNRRV